MIIPKLAFRNLVRNRKSSIALMSLVSAGVFLYLLGDSALGDATKGIATQFRDGYTADIVVKAKSERQFGIFGYSVPMIGDYEAVPNLAETPRIKGLLGSVPGIEGCAALLSGAAMIEGAGGYQVKVPVFGIVAKDYFPLFPGIKLLEGALPEDSEAWIVLPRSRAEEIGKAEGRKLAIGETLQFTMASGNAFTIRAVKLRAIVEPSFRTYSEAVPVYADVGTLRALLGLSLGNKAQATASNDKAVEAFDMDSFFGTPVDPSPDQATKVGGTATGLELVHSYLDESKEAPTEASVIDPELGTWQFLLVRLSPGASPALVQGRINSILKREGLAAAAGGWLGSAGLNAGLLYLIKMVFQIGISVLAAIIILVLTNGIAFSVMEQSREIGTMRSMGAQKAFVQELYILESLMLVLGGAIVGGSAAALVLKAIGRSGIPIPNSYLVMLFGAPVLRPELNPATMAWTTAGLGAIALVSALYPLILAGRTSLAQSMTAE